MSLFGSLPTPVITPSTPESRIVVIGAGIVGTALADALVRRGARHVCLIDQGPLWDTGGSSTHAPGFVFQNNPSRTMCTLAQRTMVSLDPVRHDGLDVVLRVGGLEIATTDAQLDELKRRRGFARAWGVPAELLSPAEVAELWPGIAEDLVLGALHTPTDGIVRSKIAVRALGGRAVEGGAEALGSTRAVEITTEDGRTTGVVVEDAVTGDDRRTLPADVVIACGGIWGPQLTRLVGFEVPMHPMEHGFSWTSPLPSLAAEGLEPDAPRRPVVRHQGAGLYFREFGDRIGIGAYEHRPIPLAPSDLMDPADSRSTGQQPAMRPFTPDDFAPTWAEMQRILPELAEAEQQDPFNGVFSFTPDGGPMLGPSRTVAGFWVAQAIWVTQSVGCADVVADWITTGDPGIDTHELDLGRFDPALLSRRFARERAAESYDGVYDIHRPHGTTAVLRGLRTTPFHDRDRDAGAIFAEANGWERAQWFEENGDLLQSPRFAAAHPEVPVTVPRIDSWDASGWSPIAALEAWATRSAVGLYDMSALTRYLVSGPGATELLETVCSARVGRAIGRVVYSLMLDANGGILSDVTVTRLGQERYLIGANGQLDREHLLRHRPGPEVQVEDVTTGTCGLGLWGPRARDVLETLTGDDVSGTGMRYFHAAEITVAEVPVIALRVSYVGELGWELYTDAAYGRRLHDALVRAGRAFGLVKAGRLAFSSLRLEKGYRSWGADMTREDRPGPSGLGFAVSPRKTSFLGYEALRREDADTRTAVGDPALFLVTVGMRMETGVPEPGSPVTTPDGVVIGWVTSADHSYVTGRVLAFVRVPAEHTEPGTALRVERFARSLPATVLRDPVFDPEGLALQR